MDIGGWKTRSMFDRYAIKDTRDIRAAIEKRQSSRVEISHDLGHDLPSDALGTAKKTTSGIN
jgi:hypothetical protein